ncbi:MAG TPA: DUF2760 domain-containing protein [Kiritimatiellia bacterium]|nr:DUF2760 domain-containing protein [Kiritimatiellia bacterium]HMP00246.1 DUF2760 domain-containing protein [Kiritimatiellia bacterium]HMP96860.1 DUF2760 domain-containing protein [Kiritimatiellia bacterium]
MRLGLAFSMFFKILGNGSFARELSAWLGKPALPAPPPAPAGPRRTDAVELLAALQREGRLIDFLQENLEGYGDAQIGAAVRDIHRDCRKTLDRMFGISALRAEAEGSTIDLPDDADPGAWKLTGNVGAAARRGKLCHPGWKITRHELPAWTGQPGSAWVVAPAEVEIN